MVKDENSQLLRSAPSVSHLISFLLDLLYQNYPWVSQQRYKQIRKS